MSNQVQAIETGQQAGGHSHALEVAMHRCNLRGQEVDQRQASHQRQRKLVIVLLLSACFMVVEIGAGLLSGSLALIADAGHMLTDVVGVGIALFAGWQARRPADQQHSYGHYRSEILAALLNALLLLAVGSYILVEAWQRWQNPPSVEGGIVLAAASVGLLFNLLSVRLLHSHAGDNLNMKAAFFEVVSDAVSSAAVLLAGLILVFTGWRYADPLFSAAIALFILPRTIRLLREAVNVLLEATPRHLDTTAIQAAILSVAGVRAVHDLHCWTLTSGVEALSAHVLVEDALTRCPQDTLCTLQALLHDRFGVDHSTLQLEEVDLQAQESSF